MKHRLLAAFCAAMACSCGRVEEDAESCQIAADELVKSWLIGDLKDNGDDPTFTAQAEVVDVELDGAVKPAFVDAKATFDVRFEITAHHLFVLTLAESRSVVAVFPIVHHRAPCQTEFRPITEELTIGGGNQWYELPWFRVDWNAGYAGNGYRFDAATAAGHPKAAEYSAPDAPPVPEVAPEIALADGYMAVNAWAYIEWKPIDEDTPGCAFDFPDLPPGSDCPKVLIGLRYRIVAD